MLLKDICIREIFFFFFDDSGNIREMLHIHFLSLFFVNQSLNMCGQMLILCDHTYSTVNLSISCIKMDKK
jgi:hypothetical protein